LRQKSVIDARSAIILDKGAW